MNWTLHRRCHPAGKRVNFVKLLYFLSALLGLQKQQTVTSDGGEREWAAGAPETSSFWPAKQNNWMRAASRQAGGQKSALIPSRATTGICRDKNPHPRPLINRSEVTEEPQTQTHTHTPTWKTDSKLLGIKSLNKWNAQCLEKPKYFRWQTRPCCFLQLNWSFAEFSLWANLLLMEGRWGMF